jgi:hypothetical protein
MYFRGGEYWLETRGRSREVRTLIGGQNVESFFSDGPVDCEGTPIEYVFAPTDWLPYSAPAAIP